MNTFHMLAKDCSMAVNGIMNSTSVRTELVEALNLDLVGPANHHAFAHELLPDAPSRW